ncbi:MAG: prepilin-type N-terminal cleavage/methylation domain-containing protein [Phycisphaerales bacterium]|nr:prepilin-type N-terminal cleavage/methylation domain-containing protein [Phycisphaerales bacterium]
MSRVLNRAKGFTLIELLVVIAIIALLIGILLPALGKARNASRIVVSTSNARQLTLGANQHQVDNDGLMPIRMLWPSTPSPTGAGSWATWTFGGKTCNAYWFRRKVFDVPMVNRPLNQYIYPDLAFPDAVPDPAKEAAGADLSKYTKIFGWQGTVDNAERQATYQLDAFRSPGDKISRQQNYPNENSDGNSSYDDVGTSYHCNFKWTDWLEQNLNESGFTYRVHNDGMRRIALASDFDPSKFIWLYDQNIDVLAQPFDSRGIVDYKNEYGDKNKGVAGYLDGHAEYEIIEPGKNRTKDYTFVFPRAPDDIPPNG